MCCARGGAAERHGEDEAWREERDTETMGTVMCGNETRRRDEEEGCSRRSVGEREGGGMRRGGEEGGERWARGGGGGER